MLCRTPAGAIVTNLGDALCDIIKGLFMGHTFSEEVKEVPLWQIWQTMHSNGTLKKDIPKCKVSIHTIDTCVHLTGLGVFLLQRVCEPQPQHLTHPFRDSGRDLVGLRGHCGPPRVAAWTMTGILSDNSYSSPVCKTDRQLSWPSVSTQTPNQLWCQKYRLSRQH